MKRIGTLAAALAIAFGIAVAGVAQAEPSPEAKVVHSFLEAWHSGDLDKIFAHVSEDCHYENVPPFGQKDPIVGKAKMRAFLADFFRKDAFIVPIVVTTEVKETIASGEKVALERVDRFEVGASKFALPVMAIFHVKDGKITYWKDFFDLATLEKPLVLMEALKRPQ